MKTGYDTLKEAVESGDLGKVSSLIDPVKTEEGFRALFTTPDRMFSKNALDLAELAISKKSIPVLTYLIKKIPQNWWYTSHRYPEIYYLLDHVGEYGDHTLLKLIVPNLIPDGQRLEAFTNSLCVATAAASGNTPMLEYLVPCDAPATNRRQILAKGEHIAPCWALEYGQQLILEYMLAVMPSQFRLALVQDLFAIPKSDGHVAFLAKDKPAIQLAEEKGHNDIVAFVKTPRFILCDYADKIYRLMQSGLTFTQVQACLRMAMNPDVLNLARTEKIPFKAILPLEVSGNIMRFLGDVPELENYHALEVMLAMQQTRPPTWRNSISDSLYGAPHVDHSVGQKAHFLGKLCNVRDRSKQSGCMII